MLGFLFAAACAVGLFSVLSRGRRRRGRRPLYHLLERIDATPAQERVIVEIVEDFRERGRALRRDLRDVRAELARLLEDDLFDEATASEIWARNERLIGDVGREIVAALGRVHEALDARQRKTLAEIVENGPRLSFYRHRRASVTL
jgi:Spy/CpxP family protein refolding chaperone